MSFHASSTNVYRKINHNVCQTITLSPKCITNSESNFHKQFPLSTLNNKSESVIKSMTKHFNQSKYPRAKASIFQINRKSQLSHSLHLLLSKYHILMLSNHAFNLYMKINFSFSKAFRLSYEFSSM